MAEKLPMLALSPTMESGTIVKWHIAENSSFSSGTVLCEVETDKATMDYEATADGLLRKIVVAEGGKVRVGEAIGITGAAEEDISSLLAEVQQPKAVEKPEPEAQPAPEKPAVQKGSTIATGASPVKGRVPGGVIASPLARAMAKELGVHLASVSGSGPHGRIVKADIERAATQNSTAVSSVSSGDPGADTMVPITEKRRSIASRLTESKVNSPHFYLTVSVVMDTLLEARKLVNLKIAPKLSLNAFFMKFVAEALRRHPAINASWGTDAITQHGSVAIALAVAQKDGLITPIVRNCAAKGVDAIDHELRDLIVRAREGRLAPEEYTKGTFTISNLGSFGVREFTAIINPPNAAILAIGEIFREPFEKADGSVGFRSALNMTLSCDHRLIDGAAAAAFAENLKTMIEHPVFALV